MASAIEQDVKTEETKAYKLLSGYMVELMVEYERDLKKILIWLLGGTRGGTMRLKILMLLRRRPMNPNQLARALNVNYRTIMHHLEVLERNGLVVRMNNSYGAPYFISDKLDKNWSVIEEVMRILGIEGEE